MEPFTKEFGSAKGIEVLFLEDVEIQKVFGNRASFASSGSMSILFFREYNRFVLKVNDWLYPLMKRIPIFAEGGILSRIYILPALNGFSYRLIVNSVNSPAFTNFESILSHYGGFTTGEAPKLRERSPDDKMVRPVVKKDVTTSVSHSKPTSGITGFIKSGYEKVKHATMGLTGTKNLTSTKKRINLSEIKKKNFRREAHSTFKKNFFEEETKLTQKFLELRRSNPNNSQEKDIKEFRRVSDSGLPTLYLNKEDVEEAIFKQKDLIEQRMYNDTPFAEKKGLVSSIKSGITGIKDSVTGMVHREQPKENLSTQPQSYVEHYQG